ncbi:DNA-processing protein DprA [Nocardia sp. NPDC059091]|uniref:DNA-processing protein DprA n=1 Tax=Actinomycetes TaxID=1760 RepID=UPI003672D504
MDGLSALGFNERYGRVVLASLVDPGEPLTGWVVSQVGAAEAVRALTGDGPAPALNRVEADLWRAKQNPNVDARTVQDAMVAAERHGYTTLIPGDPNYPTSLEDLGERAPLVLWAKGAESLLGTHVGERATITGARASTAYGEQVASEVAAELARHEMVVVSGGAYGIDAAAHRAALAEGGHTIAVMAGGADRLYPRGNADMLDRIGDVGLRISEAPLGAPPSRTRFLARARIEAALSGSTTIVEAGARSGSLVAAEQARRLGRPVGAVPGPVTSAASTGTNLLLRDGTARAVTNARDVTTLLDRAPTQNRESAGLAGPDSFRHARGSIERGHHGHEL